MMMRVGLVCVGCGINQSLTRHAVRFCTLRGCVRVPGRWLLGQYAAVYAVYHKALGGAANPGKAMSLRTAQHLCLLMKGPVQGCYVPCMPQYPQAVTPE
jgi:hypothetical protein